MSPNVESIVIGLARFTPEQSKKQGGNKKSDQAKTVIINTGTGDGLCVVNYVAGHKLVCWGEKQKAN